MIQLKTNNTLAKSQRRQAANAYDCADATLVPLAAIRYAKTASGATIAQIETNNTHAKSQRRQVANAYDCADATLVPLAAIRYAKTARRAYGGCKRTGKQKLCSMYSITWLSRGIGNLDLRYSLLTHGMRSQDLREVSATSLDQPQKTQIHLIPQMDQKCTCRGAAMPRLFLCKPGFFCI